MKHRGLSGEVYTRLVSVFPTQHKPVPGDNGKLHGSLIRGTTHKWFKKDLNDPKCIIG